MSLRNILYSYWQKISTSKKSAHLGLKNTDGVHLFLDYYNMSYKKGVKKLLSLRGGTIEAEDAFASVKADVSPAVVTIEITHPRNFGLDRAVSSQATGYVVDKAKGIICSNKHVVHAGPCRAKAKFMKNEEIDILPIYRDPVHDFGFFKFDPTHLKDTKAVQIELDPTGARRGRNALMIGNNGGEKISFVETTVARTDRGAVQLHDMNTFYITASDTSVGGSSGAPLLSVEGKAIGMMAAGNDRSNISLYLPLFRVARALEYIREGKEVPRGTIQIGFKFQSFDALLKRKAISTSDIEEVKKANKDAEGLLVVEKSLPKGPGKIAGMMNGDVLLHINDKSVVNYVQLEELLDTFIGKKLDLKLLREGKKISLSPTVQDHKDIEVDEFVEVSDGIFHATQYKLAAYVNLPIEGVFVAKRGYMFGSVPFASIIKRIGKKKIHTLADFILAVQELENGEIVSVRYQPIRDQNKTEIATITVDKRWYPFQIARRNDSKGKWDYEDVKATVDKKEGSKTAIKPRKDNKKTRKPKSELEKLTSALVEVKFSRPFSIDGRKGGNTKSTVGIVVDKDIGLVLTSRNAISSTLIDVQLVFNRSKTLHAKVLYIHPLIPVSIVKFDPAQLKLERTVSLVSVQFCGKKPEIDEELDYVGINNLFEYQISETKVNNFRDIDQHRGEMNRHELPELPNEVVGFTSASGVKLGMYMDKTTKEVKAYNLASMLSGQAQLAADVHPIIQEVRTSLKNSKPLSENISLLPVTTAFVDLSKARVNDLPEIWAEKLQDSMTIYQQKLIVIKRRMVSSDANKKLQENDVVLSVNDTVVTLIRDFYALIQGQEMVKMKILRDEEEIDLEIRTTKFSTLGTTRIIHFGGLIVQNPHPAIYYLSTAEILEGGGVYVSHQQEGSPASTAEKGNENRSKQNRIIGKLVFKVNGQNVSNLEEFKKVIVQSQDLDFVRLVAKDIVRGEISVHDIRLDLEYWKTRDMFLDENKDWISHVVDHNT